MKFTKEEISLCKKIAEKYRKPIEKGDWIWFVPTKQFIKEAHAYLCEDDDEVELQPTEVPLWTISDCLEFLREKFQKLRVCSDGKLEIEYWLKNGCHYEYGKTPLEACLKAVLAVLEEKPHG